MIFSIFTQTIASQRMKLAVSGNFERLLQEFSLEKGIILGLAFALLGLIGSFSTLWIWGQTQFGVLIPAETMRIAIPSVIFLVAGIQIIFSSFFMSFIMMDNMAT